MALIDFSTTPANNSAAPPNGAPEGMAAALVNDTIRQIMADIKGGTSIFVKTKANMSALIATKSSEGDTVLLGGIISSTDGGFGIFDITKTDISTLVAGDTQGGIFVPFDSDVTGASGGFVRKFTGPINVRWFGAKGDGIDDTAAVRGMFAFIKTQGGGAAFFPDGIYAMSTSDTPAWNARIPANTRVFGESREGVIITRPVSALEEQSILFVNDDADIATGFNAAGNITIENLTMTDSVAGSERFATAGDLIAFGHLDKGTVQNCNFGKHSQHCLDIGGSKNILFTGNIQDNDNGLTGAAENSAVQVDSANGAAFLGLNVDGTESTDVTVTNNRFININSNTLLHIGHNNGTPKNIIISNNYFKGTSRSFGKMIRMDVDGASLDGIVITDNVMDLTTADNAGIVFLTNGNASEFIKNVTIKGNVIKGIGKGGIFVGATTSFLGSVFPNIENIVIEGNTIDLDFNGSGIGSRLVGIETTLMRSCSIKGNLIKVSKTTDDADLFVISSIGCLQGMIENNIISTNLTTFVGIKDSASIYVAKFGTVATSSDVDVSVIGNNVDVSKFKFGLFNENVDNNDFILFSKNRFSGPLTNGDAHIFETIVSSDGTNGFKQIDLTGASVFALSIGIDSTFSVNTGLIKKTAINQMRSKEVIHLNYSTITGLGQLAFNTETLTNNASTIGLQIKAINPTLGTFDIVTGSAGISSTINPGGAASTRTVGSITVQAGI